jgi:hypothetical protein
LARQGLTRKCWSEFLCLGGDLAPPRQVGGFVPWDALGRHPSADPRRWRPASGPVAGAQLGIEPLDAKPLGISRSAASNLHDPRAFTASNIANSLPTVRISRGSDTEHAENVASESGPSSWCPWFVDILGGFHVDCSKFSKTFLLTLSTSGPAQAPGNLLPPLLLSLKRPRGICPCRREDLWPHCGILLTCSG